MQVLQRALFLLSLCVHGDVLGYGSISGVGRNVYSKVLKLNCGAKRLQIHFNTKATVYRCNVKLRFVSEGMHHALSMGKADLGFTIPCQLYCQTYESDSVLYGDC